MPLPPNNTPWPPKQLQKISPQLRAWDAWYAGDSVRLAEHYGYIGGGIPGYPAPGGQFPAAQYPGGVRGRIARWFWGQPVVGQQLTKLHVPVAADICQAGADLLFAEPPTLTVDDTKDTATQERLNELADDTLHGVLAEAAEIGGALGGSYLRVSWDKAVVPDKPFLTCVHADAAWPEFSYGRLTAVTFWTRLPADDNTVWRHLERHELDGAGNGVILHGLYKGTENDLGRAVPFNEHPRTEGLTRPGVLTDGQVVSTQSPGLAAVYVPNQRPQRKWRNDPLGCHLGRSDLDGIEHLMDALDETYSSWMRDIRLGKGRVFVAKTMLEDQGNGRGGAVDLDQEVFAPLNMLMNPNNQGSGLPIQAEQFAIRYAEHKATADQLLEAILRTAGYSSQTFGMDESSAHASNMTATEVQARERRSYLTRDRKVRLTGPAVAAISGKLLAVDKAIFGSPVNPQQVKIQFADSVQESTLTLAQTASALSAARAASTQTLVQIVHPDWDDEAIKQEVGRIHTEDAAAVPDPGTFGNNPTDPQQQLDPGSAGQ